MTSHLEFGKFQVMVTKRQDISPAFRYLCVNQLPSFTAAGNALLLSPGADPRLVSSGGPKCMGSRTVAVGSLGMNKLVICKLNYNDAFGNKANNILLT